MRRRLTVFLLVFALVLSLAAPAFANPNKGPAQQALAAFDQRIISRISAENALEHVRVLSEEIGTRPAGFPNEYLAGDYIASVLESYGYEVEFQEFPVTGGNANVNVGYITFEDGTLWETGSNGGGLTASGRVINAGNGAPSEYPEDIEPGFIALVRRGTAFNTIAANAVAAGAAGVIIYNTQFGGRGNYPSAFSMTASTNIPVLGAAYIHGMRLIDMIDAGEEVYVDMETIRYTNRRSRNVVAVKPARKGIEDAPVVAITGHYDSVVGSPGANDNASGVALVLEMARLLSNVQTDAEVRFIAFGAEEIGLQGARYYVNQMGQAERSRFIGVYNADMIATNHPNVTHLVAATPNGVQHLVTDSSVAAGARLGDSSLLPSTFGSSDHVPFHDAGIPAALFIWLGGNLIPSSYEIELYYHTPQDTIDENMCLDRFQTALNIIGSAIFDVVRRDLPSLTNSALRKAN